MKKKYNFCLSLALILTAFLLAMSGIRTNEEALAARIAPEILRFHVIANSDSPADQALKLEVKDKLLEAIRSGCEASASAASTFNREMILSYIEENRELLEDSAKQLMELREFDYSARISVETCAFPQKTYGDMTFPAGNYEAVRVILGAGEGENFWCVLYPSLCYTDSIRAVVPDSSKELLQTLIPEEDFQALFTARKGLFTKKSEQDSLLPRFHIRFKWLNFLNQI